LPTVARILVLVTSGVTARVLLHCATALHTTARVSVIRVILHEVGSVGTGAEAQACRWLGRAVFTDKVDKGTTRRHEIR